MSLRRYTDRLQPRPAVEMTIGLLRELFDSGTSVSAVANRFKVSNDVVRAFCATHGIATPDTKRFCGFGRIKDPASQPETAGAGHAPCGVSPQLAPPPAEQNQGGGGASLESKRAYNYHYDSNAITPTMHELGAASRAREACDRFGAMTIDGQPIRFPSVVPRVPWNEGTAIRNSAIFKQRAATLRNSAGVSTVYDHRTL